MKVQQPFIGHSSGTLAGMVYQTYHGATYMHAKPSIYHYPDTPAQQKVQGLYWNIMRQWQTIYRGAVKTFPKAMPINSNIFDIWAAGIFQGAQTYPRPMQPTPRKWFGQDKRQSVRLYFSHAEWDIADNSLKLSFVIRYRNMRRSFTPTICHVIVINKTQQLLEYAFTSYVNPLIKLTFVDMDGWRPSDELRIYAALQNNEYYTNFYRVIP